VNEDGALRAAVARMDIGRSMGRATRHGQPKARVSKRGCPWALVHVTPKPTTVSERLKAASKAAISGLPFTVSSLIVRGVGSGETIGRHLFARAL
jgi:hypothetical protein